MVELKYYIVLLIVNSFLLAIFGYPNADDLLSKYFILLVIFANAMYVLVYFILEKNK